MIRHNSRQIRKLFGHIKVTHQFGEIKKKISLWLLNIAIILLSFSVMEG